MEICDGEVLLIVLGIIIAVSIESWWSDVKDETEAKEILVGLKDEFVRNKEQLESKIAYNEQVVAAIHTLLRSTASARDPQPLSAVQMDSLIWDLVQSHTFNPETGELNVLLNSGKLQNVNNDHLEVKLAAWESLAEDMAEEEQAGVDLVWQRIIPFLNLRISWVGPASINGFVERPVHGDFGRKAEAEYQALLADPEFENLLINRLIITQKILEEEGPIEEWIDKLIESIDRNLEE